MSDLPNAGKFPQSLNPNPFGGGGLFNTSGKADTNAVKARDYAARQVSNYQPGNPYWQLTGPTNDAKSAAYDSFYKTFGRGPTSDELAQVLPAYLSGDPNITNLSAGDALVAQYHQQQENTPEKLAAKQRADLLAQAPKYYDSVNNIFQGQLGRKASQDELDHFGSLLADGNTDPYQLQQFLQQQPEYVNTQNQKFRDNLSGQLQGYDQTYFKDKILPSIQEAYAKQGRSFDSSAFQNASTQSAQQQNTSRENFLAQLSAQQYGGVQQNAYNDYANQVANQQNLTNAGIQAQYAGIQNTQNRSNQYLDYNTEAQSYNNYLAKYGKRSVAGGALQGGVSGAAAGGSVGGGWGALIGGIAGAGLGAYGASQGGSY
jgi:hypothetical protein